MVRLPALASAVCVLLVSGAAVAQTAILSLDPSPKNHCVKAGEGAMWTLRDARPNAISALQNTPLSIVTVTLSRTDASGRPARTIVQFLRPGETQDLGCSQGKVPGLAFQLVHQR